MTDTPEERAELRRLQSHTAMPALCEHGTMCICCYEHAIRSAEAVVRKELIQEISPLLEYMRNPLEASLQGLKPSADVPPNVDVCWHTSSDAVAGLLKLMDTYKRALAGEEEK